MPVSPACQKPEEELPLSSTLNRSAIAAIVFAGCVLAPQVAAARYACAVKVTSDGFVALRDGPASSGKLIARMKKDELVTLLHPPDYEKLIRRGNWIFVRYVAGILFVNAHKAEREDHDKAIPGWVNDSLLVCHE